MRAVPSFRVAALSNMAAAEVKEGLMKNAYSILLLAWKRNVM